MLLSYYVQMLFVATAKIRGLLFVSQYVCIVIILCSYTVLEIQEFILCSSQTQMFFRCYMVVILCLIKILGVHFQFTQFIVFNTSKSKAKPAQAKHVGGSEVVAKQWRQRTEGFRPRQSAASLLKSTSACWSVWVCPPNIF